MTTKRIIFIVPGWLFIFMNALAYLTIIGKGGPVFKDKTIPYVIGFHFFFALGIIFLLIASKQKRQMQKVKDQQVPDDFLTSRQASS